MKVLQLNVWTGRLKGALTRFLREHDYDIICLQEAVWSEADAFLGHHVDTVEDFKKASGLEYDARVSNWGIDLLGGRSTMEQGNVILSRYPIVEVEKKLIHGVYNPKMEFNLKNGADDDQGYYALKVKLENGLTVLCYHGYWKPDPIGDEVTVECMRKAADMIRDEAGPVLMCGDLNVDTTSPAMRELDFLTDLTAITDTKQTLMNLKFIKDVACDHILISDGVKWSNFEVHKELVSDHAAVSVELDF
ncbi:endonuclease/exonuclease/phosphatase family protein [Candidatus Saccharibacteria bacterium]|nr:endonuclease/exonuclease/phosphatase family protein [Candidatus Saccharibacteria bacterium]